MVRTTSKGAGRRKKLRIDQKALEEFRASLPAYRRREYYHLLMLRWDIVKAFYLISRYPREIQQIEVARAARNYGFHIPHGETVKQSDGTEYQHASLFTVDLEHVMDPEIDTERPVLIALVELEGKANPTLIDGFHRLYKAARQEQEHLNCYVLTSEEERVCRC